MTKVDLERVDVEEPEQFSLQYSFAEEMSWGRVVTGAIALVVSVCGAAYWAGGRSVRIEGGPKPASEPVLVAGGDLVAGEGKDQAAASGNPAGATAVALSSVTFAAMPSDVGASALPRTSVSFLTPVEGTTVASGFVVRGLARGVRADKQLWLVTRGAHAEIAPQYRITPNADGGFERRLDEIHGEGPLSICLVAASRGVSEQFERWVSAPAAARRESSMVAPGNVQVLGCQDVMLNQP